MKRVIAITTAVVAGIAVFVPTLIELVIMVGAIGALLMSEADS